MSLLLGSGHTLTGQGTGSASARCILEAVSYPDWTLLLPQLFLFGTETCIWCLDLVISGSSPEMRGSLMDSCAGSTSIFCGCWKLWCLCEYTKAYGPARNAYKIHTDLHCDAANSRCYLLLTIRGFPGTLRALTAVPSGRNMTGCSSYGRWDFWYSLRANIAYKN